MTTTRRAKLTQIYAHFAAAMNGAAFQPAGFDLSQQSLIVSITIAYRLFQPRVVATAMDAKHPTHCPEAELIGVLRHEGALCSYSFCKALSGFFKDVLFSSDAA